MSRLVIVRQRYNAAGGAERFVSRALQALRQQGELEVSLIARRWEKLDNIRAILVNPFYLGNVWRDWSFARAAKRAWQAAHFDLVQSHERIAGCHVYRAGDGVHRHWLALRQRNMSWLQKVALTLNPYHSYVKQAERSMFLDPALKKVICNSQMVKQEIQQYFGLPDQRFTIIYNGVDTTQFHPDLQTRYRIEMRTALGIAQDVPVLVYVGSGFERKGVARAIEAIANLSEVTLVVVGKDKHLPRYQDLAKQYGMQNRVHFVGAQSDVKPYYGMADAFVLPTLYDPFPNVCVEALACGLPIFTTHQCGAAELVEQGENGYVADAWDVAKLSLHIQDWLGQYSQSDRQRLAARQSVEHLTLEAMAGKLVEEYKQLLS